MSWWQVRVDWSADTRDPETAAEVLLDRLADLHAGAVALPDATPLGTWGVHLSVEKPTLKAAVGHAINAVIAAGAAAGQTDVTVVEVEGITEAEAERRLDVPDVPPLVGVAEIGEILGVTRQQAGRIVRDHPEAFRAVAETSVGNLYLREAAERYARQPRRPGRPSKATS